MRYTDNATHSPAIAMIATTTRSGTLSTVSPSASTSTVAPMEGEEAKTNYSQE